MQKNRVLTQSLTQSPRLFEVPGTKAFASEFAIDLFRWKIYGVNVPIKP